MDYRIEYFRSPDGASIAAARGGRGRPLVVIPAMVSTIETMWPTYAGAFADYELITYDRRGSGLSERGSVPVVPEPYLQDAQAVVDGFQLDDFAVLGTLIGTIEAASLASANTDRATRLVLRAPVMGLSDWATIPSVRAALAAMEHDWEFFTESFAQAIVGWGNPAGPTLAAQFRATTSRDELRAMLDAFMQLDLADTYPAIQATTLVEHHPEYFFPDAYSRRITSMIGDCRMVMFSGNRNEFLSDFSVARAFLAKQRRVSEPAAAAGFQTVLFTDLESSTELTQRLGDAAAHELLELHNATVRAALDEHGGREIKHTGDGIMASFRSAVAAVSAALQLQRELESRQVRVRVGINAGEPIAEDGDLFGTAVQLAARITDRAAAGQVLASNVVRELCAGKPFVFSALDAVSLKGFAEPVVLYEVR